MTDEKKATQMYGYYTANRIVHGVHVFFMSSFV